MSNPDRGVSTCVKIEMERRDRTEKTKIHI